MMDFQIGDIVELVDVTLSSYFGSSKRENDIILNIPTKYLVRWIAKDLLECVPTIDNYIEYLKDFKDNVGIKNDWLQNHHVMLATNEVVKSKRTKVDFKWGE